MISLSTNSATSTNSLYQFLIREVQVLKVNTKKSLVDLYKQFAQGKQPKTEAYEKIILDNSQALACINSQGEIVVACFGCQCNVGQLINEQDCNQTEHVIIWDYAQVFAWCIWDAFFITKLVGKPAKIHSVDPITGKRIVVNFDGTIFSSIPYWFTFPLGESKMNSSIRSCFCCRTKAFIYHYHAQAYARDHNCEVIDIDIMLERTNMMVRAIMTE